MRVLVVDDEPANRRLLSAALGAEGHTVLEAGDGHHALEVLAREAQGVDVVVTDVLMPGMDGYRLCFELRNHPRHRGVGIVLVSGSVGSDSDLAFARVLGADACLQKPVDLKRLAAAVGSAARADRGPAPAGGVLLEAAHRVADKALQRSHETERARQLLVRRADILSRFEEKYRGILASSPDVLRVLDARGRGVWVSENVAEVWGFSPEEATAEDSDARWWSRVHPGDASRLKEAFTALFAGQRALDEQYRLQRKDGAWIWVHERASGVQEREGLLVATATLVDITVRKELEARLAAANAELNLRLAERDAAYRELEAFSYAVSHDLRSPLRAIQGFTDILLEDHAAALDDDARALLQRVIAASERLTRLIDDLLAFGRASRAEPRREDVDAAALARAVVEQLRAADPARKVAFEVPDTLVVHADPALLRTVLENLLGNAWKYTSHKPEARIALAAERRDGGTAIVVRDDGAGFDPAKADQLFQPFKRLHTTQEFEGTGIGLATVQRIVERHGGEVGATSDGPGRGATVWFTLGAVSGVSP